MKRKIGGRGWVAIMVGVVGLAWGGLVWGGQLRELPRALASPERPARGLTAEEVRALQEGEGMGLARAAELNGYPGPAHILTAAILRAEPIEEYYQFRGYAAPSEGHGLGH